MLVALSTCFVWAAGDTCIQLGHSMLGNPIQFPKPWQGRSRPCVTGSSYQRQVRLTVNGGIRFGTRSNLGRSLVLCYQDTQRQPCKSWDSNTHYKTVAVLLLTAWSLRASFVPINYPPSQISAIVAGRQGGRWGNICRWETDRGINPVHETRTLSQSVHWQRNFHHVYTSTIFTYSGTPLIRTPPGH